MARQTAELCEAASREVGAADGVRIANFLCNGNYAVSGGVAGCDAVIRMAKDFKVHWLSVHLLRPWALSMHAE